jgi:hypothetical protein
MTLPNMNLVSSSETGADLRSLKTTNLFTEEKT